MRLLYVGPLPPYPGGSARSAVQLLAGLAQLGYTVRALAPAESAGPAGSPAAALAGMVPFPVQDVPVSGFGFDHTRPLAEEARRRDDERLRRALAREIAAQRPAAIFVGREPLAPVVVGAARAAAVPVLVRTPGGTMLEILAGRYPPARAAAIVEALRQAAAVVSPARHLAEAMAARFALPALEVVPNAIPLPLLTHRPGAKQRLGLAASDPVVAHVSNLVSCKRALDLIPAALRLRAAGVRPRYRIAGDGPQRAALEQAAAACALGWRFLGHLPYADIPEVLSAADVLVMPGDADTMPRVCLEAMAVGAVVVAADIPATRELLADGASGLLFPVGDAAAQAAAIARVLTDADLARRLRAAARRRVADRDVSVAAQRYAAILARIARPASARPGADSPPPAPRRGIRPDATRLHR